MSRAPRTTADLEEARRLGKALLALRISQSLTQRQLAEAAGIRQWAKIGLIERGKHFPHPSTLKRILDAMDLGFDALYRAQAFVLSPQCDELEGIAGAVFEPEAGRQAALKLAQDVGRAVAGCCLAFVEMGFPGRAAVTPRVRS
jgi:transcriptional regulator with XRE-family HTH domain